jgi:hypothetical protein
METFVTVILEIIKITVPALVVFFTVYYVLKLFLEKDRERHMAEMKKEQIGSSFPLKMQAYERLAIFCERISIPNLLLRVRRENMSADDLRLALMMAIRQEYEHNISQQVYISDKLWEIIVLARDETNKVINALYSKYANDPGSSGYAEALNSYWFGSEKRALDVAKLAIKKEIGAYL